MSYSLAPPGGLARQLAGRLSLRSETPPLFFLGLLVLGAAATTPGFLTEANLQGVLEQSVVVIIVGLALNQVILAGEIDISVGSLLAVCAFIYGNVALQIGGVAIPTLAAVLMGLVVGLLNGALITYGRTPSIITTLVALFVLRGAVLLLAGSQVLNIDESSRFLGIGKTAGAPTSIVVAGAVFLVFELLSRHSEWGRSLIAIGGNPAAAADIGLPVKRVRLWAFIATGAACGLGSAIYLGQIGQLQATAATGFELRAIAAIVLGGTSIRGGVGSTYAPLIGACLVGVILDVMTLNRVPGTYELLVLGGLILGAISLEGVRNRLARGRA